jgi:hypothetical protein
MPLYSEDYTFHVVSPGPAALAVGGTTIISVLTPSSTPAPAPAPHSPCVLGEKLLDDGSDACVSQVCADDKYCCNGGYLSYYATESVWDAKCVAEARAKCPQRLQRASSQRHHPRTDGGAARPAAGRRPLPLVLAVQNNTADPNVSLSWSSARQHKEVIPTSALYPAVPAAAGAGGGLNVVLFKAALAPTARPR